LPGPGPEDRPLRSTPPSPLPERHLNPLQDDIVDFAPLPKGRLP